MQTSMRFALMKQEGGLNTDKVATVLSCVSITLPEFMGYEMERPEGSRQLSRRLRALEQRVLYLSPA